MIDLLIRLLIAIVVAAVIVWLLSLAGLPSLIVGIVALIVFILVLFGDDLALRRR
jgi:hypothetical protein